MSSTSTVVYSLLGGIIPALVWLAFWLREDSKRPEPKGRLIETFLAGMLAVILVLPFQKFVAGKFPGFGIVTFGLWALLEEGFKYLAAHFTALTSIDDDEPVDTLIYMITAALGFVALENTLFIWNPLLSQDIIGAVSTGSMRFIGASLLHVVASGVMGLSLAASFYKSRPKKMLYGLVGITLAIAIHTTFNLFILHTRGSESLGVFATVWIAAALLLFLFEKVKAIARPRRPDII
ncbi:PrsW family intramembrane metalloprotease [Candidatus Parcubacteria bacterium]|nr:PrsW family intramembrane metalloprotease [Candidatus Parcubacteria bacterium]